MKDEDIIMQYCTERNLEPKSVKLRKNNLRNYVKS